MREYEYNEIKNALLGALATRIDSFKGRTIAEAYTSPKGITATCQGEWEAWDGYHEATFSLTMPKRYFRLWEDHTIGHIKTFNGAQRFVDVFEKRYAQYIKRAIYTCAGLKDNL